MPIAKPVPAAAGKAAAGDSAAAAASPAPAVANGNGTPQKPPIPAAAFDMPKPNLRGLNKPKCIQCGNVARSRCPFQCCKACCYKAQNPCHIHVLKQTNTLPDKPSPTSAPVSEQPSTNPLLTGSVSRLASLQRLPHHFLSALRTKKSLAKKDVASINKWRFMKLKEHMQGEIDAENEAYERYTQNVGLLEETFCPTEDAAVEPEAETTFSERLVSEAIVRLKSDDESAHRFKERVATILDQKLKKLLERQTASESEDHQSPSDQNRTEVKLTAKQKAERTAKMNDLLGKLSRASSEDDLEPCRGTIAQLFGSRDDSSTDRSTDRTRLLPSAREPSAAPPYSFPKPWTRRVEVDESFASTISSDELASSLGQVAQL